MAADTPTAASRRVVRWLDVLGRISDEPGRLTRTFLSPAMRRANAQVAAWMREAGLAVREDTVGNLIGRREGAGRARRTLLLGSHLDTVRDAGRFDGALGVLLPIAALAELRRTGVELPFAVEVLGFSEEEGVRFSRAYLGSKAYIGRLTAADLRLCDPAGVSIAELLATQGGHAQFRLPKPAHRRRDLLGYVEVHIEQGPVLEAKQFAVGTVSAIAGQTRGRLVFTGRAGHAGTTPMALRRDALAGAAEWMLAVEALARSAPPLVATVGTISVAPGAPNVIPGSATLTLDIRHPVDAARARALNRLLARARTLARARGLDVRWEQTQANDAVTCDRVLSAQLAASVRALQGRDHRLVSGAGHDAVVLAALTPVTMLFVRCRDGLSHHPDEYAAPADIDMALRVLIDFLRRMSHQVRP